MLDQLYELIQSRERERPAGSYTTYLFDEGLDKILKKVGEESAETIIAAKNEDRRDDWLLKCRILSITCSCCWWRAA